MKTVAFALILIGAAGLIWGEITWPVSGKAVDMRALIGLAGVAFGAVLLSRGK